MKNEKNCKVKGCWEKALTLSEYCWPHTPDKNAYKKALLDELEKTKSAHGFNLKKVELEGVNLSTIDFSEANLSQSVLKNSDLFHNNFEKADLLGSDFSRSDLTGSTLARTDLTRSNFIGAKLWLVNAEDTILSEADLTGADLWQCRLYNARLWSTDLIKAKNISKHNFSKKRGKFFVVDKIDEVTHAAAEDAYRNLKRYFISHGKYNDASWASFKEKTMERKRLKKDKNIAYIPVALMGLLCGYGEKPHRVILSSSVIMFLYAAAFYLLKAVRYPTDKNYVLNIWDHVYYSVVTFTTLGYGDIVPRIAPLYKMLAVSEAFVGAFMMGLFVFTLARKYSAR